MTGGVRKFLVGSVVLAALIAVAGCSHYLFAEREPWRREAEVACLNSGVVESVPGRVRISSVEGPGACGIDYPLRVSVLGEREPLSSGPLSYDDAPLRPPSSIPNGDMPQQWPSVQSSPLPPPQGGTSPYGPPPPYGQPQYSQPQYRPPQYGAPQYGSPAYGQPQYAQPQYGSPPYSQRQSVTLAQPGPPLSLAPPSVPQSMPPLGPPAPVVTAAAGPVEVKPPATLACPIVSALDKWISEAVQPAALKWFRQPVVEIKQLGGYSCRGMNGNPNAHISEHAFGNALDIAEFDLADGHRISVQYGWHGTPEEQGFLHDVQGAACQEFTTVLAPGANVYHYNHIHVDLMRRTSRRFICEPGAIPGEVAAARARAQYAAQHHYPGVTGSIKSRLSRPSPTYSRGDDDRLPEAEPGDD
ncbi:MAG: extensin family protein [Xanthobacteraceae bacterium]